MDTSTNEQSWGHTISGEFNGIPCRIIEETHVILDPQGKSTVGFVNSNEYKALERSGIEVHRGAYS